MAENESSVQKGEKPASPPASIFRRQLDGNSHRSYTTARLTERSRVQRTARPDEIEKVKETLTEQLDLSDQMRQIEEMNAKLLEKEAQLKAEAERVEKLAADLALQKKRDK